MRLLLHICCANCGLYPMKTLASKGVDFKGFWFNPNIQPDDEYSGRLRALEDLRQMWSLDIEVKEGNPARFLSNVESHAGLRCEACYRQRLNETAATAKKMGIGAFGTTLLVSPYQRFDLIVQAGTEAGKEHGVRFYAEDWRPGFAEGVKMSRELGLYRQKYCGCLLSKEEAAGAKQARVEGSK